MVPGWWTPITDTDHPWVPRGPTLPGGGAQQRAGQQPLQPQLCALLVLGHRVGRGHQDDRLREVGSVHL